MFFSKIKTYVLNRRSNRDGDMGMITVGAVFLAALAASYTYCFQQLTGKTWHEIASVNAMITVWFVISWVFVVIYLWVAISELRDETLHRVRQLMLGHRVYGSMSALAETTYFSCIAITYAGIAYALYGRIDGFRLEPSWLDFTVHAATLIALTLPPVTSAFIAVTAYKVRAYPAQTFQN